MAVDAPLKRGSYYYIPGIPKPLVAVTTILNCLAKPALIYWAAKTAGESALENPWQSVKEVAGAIYKTRDEAGMRGKDVHKLIENYIRGGKTTKTKQIKGYIEAYQRFKKDVPHRIIASEKIVWSKKCGYAGTLDCIAKKKDGELVILDFKTGKYVYEESALQLTAYLEALREMYPKKKRPERTMVVHLKPDSTYSFIEKTAPLSVFLALKKVWEWQQEVENNGKK